VITKAAIACVLVVGAFAALQTNRLRLAELDVANQRVDWERESGRAVRAAVDEGNRRAAAVQKEVEHARKKVNDLEGAAVRAAVAGRSLQSELALARGRACATDTSTPGGSAAAEAAERMLADVQRRLDQAQERVARHADQARIAGLACEGSYRALTP
jgi:predicted  nucleic acid-binding Zn-ribbon protein